MSGIFDLFSSKKNVDNIRDNISSTILNEFNQKIGNRYDGLIETKIKEVMSKVSEKVPEGKNPKEYILMMNKKVISLVIPTVRANALKEKPKQEVVRKRLYDDPLDLLKKENKNDDSSFRVAATSRTFGEREVEDNLLQRSDVQEQFNLPLEDMTQRLVPDYPRPQRNNPLNRMDSDKQIYQQFGKDNQNMTIPKFQDDLPEKRPGETLAMFQQLQSRYEEERLKDVSLSDQSSRRAKIDVDFQQQRQHMNQNPNIHDQSTPIQTSKEENLFQKKKIVIRKNKMETPIQELQQVEEEDDKMKNLLTTPQVPIPMLPFQKEESKNHTIQIHFSSNYRNFMYHQSPSFFRIYLTPYFDNQEDPFVFFNLPEFIDKRGNKIYNSFSTIYSMKHHIQIPHVKNLISIKLDKVKIYQKEYTKNKIYSEILPKIQNQLNTDFLQEKTQFYSSYHNQSYLKRDLLLYDESKSYYINPFQSENHFVDLKSILHQNYLEVKLCDQYGDYIHYDKDIQFVYKIDKQKDTKKVDLHIQIKNDQDQEEESNIKKYKNKQIYIYSLYPEENVFVEFGDQVFAESFDKISDTQFRFCGLYVMDDDNNYKIHFKELFDKTISLCEDDSHRSISDLFYFVIKQLKDHKPTLYYCHIDYIDELGNIVLSHKNMEQILENFDNTEQFGFIKKNYYGNQKNDHTSLFRKRGYMIQDVTFENKNMIFTIECDDQNIEEHEAFLRFEEYEIDLFLNLTFR